MYYDKSTPLHHDNREVFSLSPHDESENNNIKQRHVTISRPQRDSLKDDSSL